MAIAYSFTLWIIFFVVTVVDLIIGDMATYLKSVPNLVLRAIGIISSTCMFIVSITPQRYIFFNANNTITTINVTVDFSPSGTDILNYLWVTISLLLLVLCLVETTITGMPEGR